MSLIAVRQSLENRLKTLSPSFATAWENQVFTPPSDQATPYQEVFLLPAEPDSLAQGPRATYREHGLFQVTLSYEMNQGSKDALLRAESLRSWYPRGLSLVQSGVTTIVERTPEIGVASTDEGRYRVPVRVRWYANVEP